MKPERLIIPDVHGRTFWKEAVEMYPDLPVTFLGDYLDPYPQEGFSRRWAINNFSRILELKGSRPDDVTLLLGNHDFGYILAEVCSCRRDRENYGEIAAMFEDGLGGGIFAMCHYLPEHDILMSHAGVRLGWVDTYLDTISPEANGRPWGKITAQVAEDLNARLKERSEKFFRTLDSVSFWRGGIDEYGSMVWADIHEMASYLARPIRQIFGHTQLAEDPIVTDHWACLDCRRAFILGDDGKIYNMDKTAVPLTYIKAEKSF